MRKPLRFAVLLATWFAAFLVMALLLAPRYAGAQPRPEHVQPHGGFEHRAPHFAPHLGFDGRFNHDHFYPAPGVSVAALPPGHLVVNGRNDQFFFHAGVWYRHVGLNYVVVRPPLGLVVPVLPPAYTTVWLGSVPYYYANDIYYAAAPGGYAVVQPPADPSVAPPPQAAAAPAPAGNWYYCDSTHSYYPYVSQCAEGWRTVPAMPPPPQPGRQS
jgi:hypothetical protein